MEVSFRKIFSTPETRAKVFTTIWLLLAYRVGFQVPIPGMDPEFLTGSSGNALFGLMSAFSGGQLGQTTIFGLGIMPYISASIIFSMLTKISPTMEAVAKEGASGQKKINQWTRLATVPIALVQSFFVYTGVFLARKETMVTPDMQDSTWLLGIVVIASLIAGAMIVMWIGELITEHGVGNGASLIIMAGIIATMPQSFATLAETAPSELWSTLLFIVGIWSVVVFVVVFMHKGARRIPVQYARLTRGRRVYGGQRHYLPLKVNMAGVMPIIFASVLFVIPGILFAALDWNAVAAIFQDQTGFIYVSIYVTMVFTFCFFWNRLMFRPEEIADNLREHGSFIPGIRPGAKTAEYLSSVLTRLTIVGAAFLAVVAVAPAFVIPSSMPPSVQYFIGGTSVLIVVGVALDLVDKLSAQLVMRNFEGQMKESGPGWTKQGEES